MNDETEKRLLSDIVRLDGILDEIERRQNDIEFGLAETNRRLVTVVVIVAIGFAVLMGGLAAMYFASYL